MTEATFEIQIPTPLLRYGFSRDNVQHRIIEWLVLSLFTEGYISLYILWLEHTCQSRVLRRQ